jgi:hypothetical protein
MRTPKIRSIDYVHEVGRKARPGGEEPRHLRVAAGNAARTVAKRVAGRGEASPPPTYRAVRLTDRR